MGGNLNKDLRHSEVISGGTGNDTLIAGLPDDYATDSLSGGDGYEVIFAANRPAARDIICCGAGNRDYAIVDRKDVVGGDCEYVAVLCQGE